MAAKSTVSSDVEHDGIDDFELAFDLQTQEAIDASLADSFVAQEQYYEYEYTTAVSVTESVAYEDVGLMTALLLEDMEKISQEERDRQQIETDMEKISQEVRDRQQIETEAKKLKDDLNRRIHDQRLAFEISRIPDAEWDTYGDNFERPYGNDAAVPSSSTAGSSSRALVETECCRLYFKGLVSDERVKEEDVKVAAIGAAVCDPRDNLLFEVRKPVETYFEDGEVITSEMAELVALVEGLKAALELPLDSLTFFTDDYMLYQYITGRLVPRRSKSVSFIKEVQSLQKNFTCCYPSHVARNDVKFAFKFAREAIISQISWSDNIGKRKSLKETCSICLEDTDVHRMFTIEDCLHRYCYRCMKQHVEVKLLSGKLLANCPYEGCETKVNVESCERFLDPKLIKVMTQRIKESLIPFADRVYCPFPKCSALMSKTEVLQHTKDVHIDANLSGARKCLKCSEMFCVSCQVPWHKNVSCKDYNSSSSNAQNEDVKLKSLASNKKWRRCEICRTLVELSEGCYHITCRCGHEFCYTCGSVWKKNKATCSCPIWDEHNILRE